MERGRVRHTIVLFILFSLSSLAWAQIIHIPAQTPEQGKAFSEFNHRMTGVFLMATGILAAAGFAPRKLSVLGRIWPLLFILPGLYLAVMSDPEVWPVGAQSWLEAFQANPEARQHKIFAILLLALGFLELQRSRKKLRGILAVWSFPALAVFGAVLLFFHPHTIDETGRAMQDMPGMSHGGMGHEMHGGHQQTPPDGSGHQGHAMTETMLKVQNQHFWFSIAGFAVALLKFLYDTDFWKRPFVPFLWPAAMSVLGLLLIVYTE